jgi:2-polyprenyl-3-methyl-5-hydroxy-6-metoxy-1,4-benzoquinol methylase
MYRKKIYEKYLTSDNYENFDEITKQFETEMHVDSNIIKALPRDKKSKIIDIGCGFGRWLRYLQKNGYENITGVDVGEEQNRFLNQKKITVIKSDIINYLKTTKDRFDVATCFDVLEHFNKNEILELLPLVKNILRNEGVLIIRVPNGEAMFKGGIMYGDFTHETFFTQRSLKQVLSITGFSEVKTYPLRPIKHGLKSTIRHYGFCCYEIIYRVGILFETGSAVNYIATQNFLAVIKK